MPLYEQSVIILGSVMMKAHQLTRAGTQVRTFTLFLTDGADDGVSAPQSRAADVRFLVTDMTEFASNHIIAGMGIGSPTEFTPMFVEMGIRKNWILTAASSDEDISIVNSRESSNRSHALPRTQRGFITSLRAG